MSAPVTTDWERLAACVRAVVGKLRRQGRAARGKLASLLRAGLSRLPLRIKLQIAALALWLAVQRFRLGIAARTSWLAIQRFLRMPRSIDIGTELHNHPSAQVRELEQQLAPLAPSEAGKRRRVTRRGPTRLFRRHHQRVQTRKNPRGGLRPPRMPAGSQNPHLGKRPRRRHRMLDGVLMILALIQSVIWWRHGK